MKRDQIIKVRASEYEKAVLKALTEKSNRDVQALTESDVVRLAIIELAKKHIALDLERLKKEYGVN